MGVLSTMTHFARCLVSPCSLAEELVTMGVLLAILHCMDMWDDHMLMMENTFMCIGLYEPCVLVFIVCNAWRGFRDPLLHRILVIVFVIVSLTSSSSSRKFISSFIPKSWYV